MIIVRGDTHWDEVSIAHPQLQSLQIEPYSGITGNGYHLLAVVNTPSGARRLDIDAVAFNPSTFSGQVDQDLVADLQSLRLKNHTLLRQFVEEWSTR